MNERKQGTLLPTVSMRVELDDELHRMFKSACALEGSNMNKVVKRLIRNYLKQKAEGDSNEK